MAATQTSPIYTVYIIVGDTKYNVTPAVVALDRSEEEKQIAQSVKLQLMDVQVSGSKLSSLIKTRSRVYIYADDGTKKEEVFRGYIWARTYNNSLTDMELLYKCYDNLIYFQESDDSAYYSSGKKTKDVMTALCKKWGIKLEYSYESITHAKLVLRGKLSDIFTADILDLVKDRSGKKYVIRSEKDVMQVKTRGDNTTIYHFLEKQNTTQTSSSETMDGMITKVVIVGKANSNGREPVEATIKGKTDQYGTLQKIIDRDSNTSLADAKKEAQSIIDENGKPHTEFEVKAVDVPWIRRGDKIYVQAGDMKGYYIVTGISRTIGNKANEMSMTVEKA